MGPSAYQYPDPRQTAIVAYDGVLHDLPAYKIIGHTIEAAGLLLPKHHGEAGVRDRADVRSEWARDAGGVVQECGLKCHS